MFELSAAHGHGVGGDHRDEQADQSANDKVAKEFPFDVVEGIVAGKTVGYSEVGLLVDLRPASETV